MVQPPRRQVDQGVQDSIDLFKRARVGEIAAVEPRRPQRVLVALDGSTQDELAVALARDLRERFDCAVTVLDAREAVQSNDLAARIADSLQVSALPKAAGDSFEQILAALASSQRDLLVVPCPYGRDLQTVGPDSTGTVIDVLLARSAVPILVVRKPFEPKGKLFRELFLILTAENEAAPAAAAWAAGLIESGGSLRLMLILEKESWEDFHALLQSIAPEIDVSPESLARALEKTHSRLHRSLQKAASEIAFDYQLSVQREREADPIPWDEKGRRPLLVLALERADRASQGRVQDRIRFSPNSVLVVPSAPA